jgi:hypothetical protein
MLEPAGAVGPHHDQIGRQRRRSFEDDSHRLTDTDIDVNASDSGCSNECPGFIVHPLAFDIGHAIRGRRQAGHRHEDRTVNVQDVQLRPYHPAIAPACSIAWRDVSEKSTGQRMRSIRGMMKTPSHVVEHHGLPLI